MEQELVPIESEGGDGKPEGGIEGSLWVFETIFKRMGGAWEERDNGQSKKAGGGQERKNAAGATGIKIPEVRIEKAVGFGLGSNQAGDDKTRNHEKDCDSEAAVNPKLVPDEG